MSHCIRVVLFPPTENPDRQTIDLPKGWKMGLLSDNDHFSNAVVIETDYFGGFGEQHATVYKDGKVLPNNEWNPKHNKYNPINLALKFMGLESDPDKDEFDTINLGNYRDHGDIPLTFEESEF